MNDEFSLRSYYPPSKCSEAEIDDLYQRFEDKFQFTPRLMGYPDKMFKTEEFYQLMEKAIATDDPHVIEDDGYFPLPGKDVLL